MKLISQHPHHRHDIPALLAKLSKNLTRRLLTKAGGAPGLHFYSMNQSALTLEICKRLRLA